MAGSGAPHSRFVEVEGHRVHLVEAGQGPALVLVHGSPVSSHVFRRQLAELSSQFRVVAPDLLGFGRSAAPAQGADFRLQARVLGGLLDQLDLGPLRLVLHDWGGPIGLSAVAERPEQVQALMLVNTTFLPDFRPPWYWRGFTARGLGEALVVRLNLFGRGLPLLLRAARSPELRRVYRGPLEAESSRRTVLALERLEGFADVLAAVPDWLARASFPVWIAYGSPDPYFRQRERERLVRAVPRAKLVELIRAGHFPQEDAPEAFSRVLAEFLASSRSE